jgi:DNA-binding transcriptional regulator LsrR (DeoR family)
MAESLRLMGRNGEIWRHYVRGMTQEAIGEKFNLDQSTVSTAIAAVRDSIPQQERDALIKEEIDFLRRMRTELLDVWDMKAAPVTAGQLGEIVKDPETQEVVRDHSGRLAAAARIESISARMHKLLGLEASQKIDLNVGEEEAAKRAAADALNHLHGGDA